MSDQRYIGLVPLDTAISSFVQVRNSSNVPIDADSSPTYRIYNNGSLVASGTLSSFLDDGSITAATTASPVVVTSAGHGLQNGMRVTISGIAGLSGANGTFTVASATTDTFALAGSTGSGAYTSGGTWHASGAYLFTVTPTSAGGFASGQNYSVLVNYAVSSTVYAQELGFTVT